ncbi:MAG: hypothetical protein AAGG38_14640, partial [Planctomycetota bacterium]
EAPPEAVPKSAADAVPDCLLDLHYAADAPAPRPIDWAPAQDLAFRAHALVQQHVGRPLPVRATLAKRIPTGAGLGGGSSDAAAMILGLDRLFGLSLALAAQHQIAQQLGSDVHFALHALRHPTAALVAGFGDQLEPLPPSPTRHFTLILPPFACPTAPVYRAFDHLSHPRTQIQKRPRNLPTRNQSLRQQEAPASTSQRRDDPARPLDSDHLRTLAASLRVDARALHNDLEAAAVHVQPALGELLADLRRAVNHPVHVTGSGSACFVLADSADHAQTLAQNLNTITGVPTLGARTR